MIKYLIILIVLLILLIIFINRKDKDLFWPLLILAFVLLIVIVLAFIGY